ncbi:MBG domain-containing protein [Pedobacter sp. UC225_61]|uniref:MBG domain-containing protein n=1 Tax=Pedobacter sp. UC225_61 TaxID=3374623 RepID=UPI0037AF6354
MSIKGFGFNAVGNQNIVFFGSAMAKVIQVVSPRELIVAVPVGANNGAISVTNLGTNLSATYTNGFDVTYTGGAINFDAPVSFATGTNGNSSPYAIIAKDLNGDGLIDFAVSNDNESSISIYQSTSVVGTPNFVKTEVLTGGGNAAKIRFADFDGDGKDDLISWSSTASTVQVFHNVSSPKSPTKAIAFAAPINTAMQITDFVVVDVDGDGKLDVMFLESANNLVRAWKNTSQVGNISFGLPGITAVDPTSGAMAIGDLDNDGKVDIAVTSGTFKRITILKNTSVPGTFSFTPNNTNATDMVNPTSIAIADMNKDGLADIVLTDNTTSGLVFKQNLYNLSFATDVAFATGSGAPTAVEQISIGDADGDGFPDILLGYPNLNQLALFRNAFAKGTAPVFEPEVIFNTGVGPRHTTFADVDGDGKLDLVNTNYWASSFSIQLNKQNLPAEVLTLAASNIVADGAVLNGQLKANTAAFTPTFVVGQDPNLTDGISLGTDDNVNVPAGSAFVTQKLTLTGKAPGQYYFRLSGVNPANPSENVLGDILPFEIKATVVSFKATSGNPVSAANLVLNYEIEFSSKVDGLTVANFGLKTTGSVISPAINQVVKNPDPTKPNSWLIEVYPGVGGEGTLGLELVNDAGISAPIAGLPISGEVYTIVVPPSTPQGLTAVPGDAMVTLNWSANPESDVASYEIYGGTTPAPTTLLKSVSVGTSTYIDANLTKGITYYYRITAKNTSGIESTYSNESSATPKEDQTITFAALADKVYGAIDFPLTATSSSNRSIIYSSSDDNIATIIGGNTLQIKRAGTVTIYADVPSDNTYNAAPQVARVLNVLPAPITVKATAATKVIGADDPVLTYEMVLGQIYNNDVNVLSGTPIREVGEAKGVYKIHQGNVTATANYSLTFLESDFTITDVPVNNISAPQGLTATEGDTQVKLAWNANPESDLSSYEIYGGTSPNPTTLIQSISGGILTYTHLNLTNGIKYYYRITTKNTSGTESAYSAEVSATPIQGQVAKIDQTITFPALTTKVYDDVDFAPGATASSGYKVSYSTSDNNVATIVNGNIHILHAGTVTIYADQAGDATYNAAGQVYRVLTILPAPISVKAKAASKIEGAKDPVLDYYVAVGKLHDNNDLSGTPERDLGEVPGIVYKIHQGTVKATADYSLTFLESDFTITPAPINNISAPQSLTANTGDAQVQLSWSANPESDLASYEIYGGTSANPTTLIKSVQPGTTTYMDMNLTNGTTYYYRITATNASGTESAFSNEVSATPQASPILKLNQTITFAALADKLYGDADFDLTATASSGLSVTYSSSDNNIATVTGNTVHILHAGTVTIYADQAGDNIYNKAGQVSHVLSILPRPITVKVNAASKVEGALDPILTYQVLDQLYNNDVNVVSGSPQREGGEGPGTYPIHQGQVTATADYSISFIEDNFTITAAPAGGTEQTITFGALPNKIYGDADFDLTATASSNLAVTYSSSDNNIATIINGKVHVLHAGTVTIYADQTGDNSYNAAPQSSQTLTIDKLTINVTANSQAKVYGAADPNLTYTYTPSLIGTDVFTGSLSRIAGEVPGSYGIKQGTLALSNDYNIVYKGAGLIIDLIPLTITVDAKTKVYGTADPALTYKLSSGALLAGDAMSGSLSRVAGENVGSYWIIQGDLNAGTKYKITLVSEKLYISQAPITVAANAMSKNIGDVDPVLSYKIISGALVGTDILSGSLDRVAGESIGSYVIGQGSLLASNNYIMTFIPSTFSITLKSALDFSVHANNILTPNGDGINDKLVINGIEKYPTVKLTIVDREGRTIYRNDHYQNDFDGTYKGSPLATDTYYYVVDFGKEFGKIKGFFTIIN